MAERRSPKDGSWGSVQVLETRLGVTSRLVVVHNSSPANASVLHRQSFSSCQGNSKRLRIDIYSELAPTFLPSIAALLVATAETVTHLCVQYSSYSTWDGFINHISAIHSQPRFTSLQQFSATTPIPLWSELDADLPHRFPGYAPNLQHLLLHGLPLSSFAVGPNINSLALTNLNSVYDDATSTVFALCLLDTLRHTPRLSMLMVGAPPESTLHLNASNSLAPVVLPHLHTFSFLCMLSSTHRCGFLASLIVAPQLQTLSVGLANVPNTKDFISLNSSKISVIAGLHLLGNTSAYLEFTSGGAQKLLSSLTGSNLRSIDFLDLVGSFDFDADHIVDVQRGLLEILTHALSLPAIRLLVIPPLFLPPHPGSRRSLMSSLFDDLPRDSKAKHILEAHAVCLFGGKSFKLWFIVVLGASNTYLAK
ncbi:hypothetical protein MIND_00088500 [Mycena indigotica]|uniref:Uncharacterized protein n=1 Tax=Mycena indigotica TaxID=2126181 RepID=A0A8H6TFC8_9AGAR|nr:uncharacterized protein MIND_00088500 [Mycena indigotica]KAF7315727.1 hypothetical protein MIND_00088500 [Mycena indigotica]